MKISIGLLAAIAVVLGVGAAGAGANGSPYSPGLVHGWTGVAAPDGELRYVTLDGASGTTVAAVRTNGGRIERWNALPGHYGIPLVAYDGTAGGVSGNGRRLVVATYGPMPGKAGRTRFAVLDTKTLRVRRDVVLDGSWSFDAISPDGSVVYLTQHVRAGEHPVYRVRTFEVRTGLLRGALVDRLEGEADMGGEPVTRASSADGRWAYTLYARRGHEPFVHALDTTDREAYCIDLPLELGYDAQWRLRLRLHEADDRLVVRNGRGTLASVDTGSWKVESEER